MKFYQNNAKIAFIVGVLGILLISTFIINEVKQPKEEAVGAVRKEMSTTTAESGRSVVETAIELIQDAAKTSTGRYTQDCDSVVTDLTIRCTAYRGPQGDGYIITYTSQRTINERGSTTIHTFEKEVDFGPEGRDVDWHQIGGI